MTSKEILNIILCLGEEKGLRIIGKSANENEFSRITFSFDGKVFDNVILKYKNGYKIHEVAKLISSSLEIFELCEKKPNIFRRIANGLLKYLK